MNAREACEFLGISERNLNRYTALGRLPFQKVAKAGGGFTREFDEAELTEFKKTMGQRPGRIAGSNASTHTDTAIVKAKRQSVQAAPIAGTVQEAVTVAVTAATEALADRQTAAFEQFGRVVADAISQAVVTTLDARPAPLPPVPIEAKPLLKLKEAQQLSGLSRDTIRAAIGEGKLPASQIGRAWRIKRQDLDRFIAKL